MSDVISKHLLADKRLSITRETELLQSFVRGANVNYKNVDEEENKNTTIHQQSLLQTNKSQDNEKNEKLKQPTTQQQLGTQLINDINKKMKKRKKSNIDRKHEEIYCDKDRAAAVNLGSKDIKHSLKLKRKQDRSKALQIPEESEPSSFLALGNYEMCRGDLGIALNFISKALELNPTEKNALVARSKCYILLDQPENALKDAETALNIDKNFMKAIYQKGESLYYLGDFEHSLVYFHRGLHLRPDNENFKLGIYKAQKAIENAIGFRFSSRKFSSIGTNMVSNSNKSTNSSFNLVNKNNKSSLNINDGGSGRTTVQSNISKSSNIPRKTSRVLRELAVDKKYLNNLIHNPEIKCKYSENNSNIEKCVKESIDYLKKREEFWRQQLPAHFKLAPEK